VILPLLLLLGCSSEKSTPSVPPAAPTSDKLAHPAYCRKVGAYTETSPGISPPSEIRPANTYSIVARDPGTGELGVAVQSHWFAVGSLVAWAEPGVGAVATQSFVDPAYGPNGLKLMRDGIDPKQALEQLVRADAAADVRQVGMVDAQARVAAHTGAKCIAFASHHTGAGYTVQANLMGNDRVVPAMAKAFESATGDLAARMLAALDAAQAEGGDVRGCQSAALLVVTGNRSDKPWAEKRFDLRIEDHPTPLVELRRLLGLARAYEHMNKGDLAVEKGDMTTALAEYGSAAQISPDSAEMLYWQAVGLASHGDVDRAIPLFRRAFSDDPRWIEVTRRLHKPGLIPDTPEGRALVDRIIREAKP
jgi:uncharacterized Ntn-hydrolase superfamily protein